MRGVSNGGEFIQEVIISGECERHIGIMKNYVRGIASLCKVSIW